MRDVLIAVLILSKCLVGERERGCGKRSFRYNRGASRHLASST